MCTQLADHVKSKPAPNYGYKIFYSYIRVHTFACVQGKIGGKHLVYECPRTRVAPACQRPRRRFSRGSCRRRSCPACSTRTTPLTLRASRAVRSRCSQSGRPPRASRWCGMRRTGHGSMTRRDAQAARRKLHGTHAYSLIARSHLSVRRRALPSGSWQEAARHAHRCWAGPTAGGRRHTIFRQLVRSCMARLQPHYQANRHTRPTATLNCSQ